MIKRWMDGQVVWNNHAADRRNTERDCRPYRASAFMRTKNNGSRGERIIWRAVDSLEKHFWEIKTASVDSPDCLSGWHTTLHCTACKSNQRSSFLSVAIEDRSRAAYWSILNEYDVDYIRFFQRFFFKKLSGFVFSHLYRRERRGCADNK